MTIQDALKSSHLPPADAEVLLSATLGKDRVWLLAHALDELTPHEWTRFMTFVERRRHHEPVPYITNVQEFYGRPFFVDDRVLIPRPATEGIVARALQFLKDGKDAVDDVDAQIVVTAKNLHRTSKACSVIVDVGTGSGAIAVTLALELPQMKIIATDISGDALEVAKINAERLGVMNRMNFREGSGLDPVADLTEPFLLVCNPPYIPSGNDLMPDVKDFEPHVALFGGKSGIDIRTMIITQAENHPMCIGYVMEGMSAPTSNPNPKP